MKSIPEEVLNILQHSRFPVAFTGAGISVESGIPPFRGPGGIWNKYDPEILDISYFLKYPEESWEQIRKMFYEVIEKARPNPAHYALAEMENQGRLKGIITQNIDNLHQKAGNKKVVEYHGNTRDVVCLECGKKYPLLQISFEQLPPRCPQCGGLLKPDFVFFGEPIPADAALQAEEWMKNTDLLLVIGTSGVVVPASLLPYTAKQYGAKIIEVNLYPSEYTNRISDYFLQGKASEILPALIKS